MSVQLITDDYLSEVTREPLPVVVEFFARWCPKCALMSEIVERLSAHFEGQILFKKVDIDVSRKDIQELGVEIVPTFIVYQNGEIMGYTIGVLTEQVLASRILEMLQLSQ